MSKWYVSIDNKASGPFDSEEIVDSIKQRKYVLVDLVFEEGGSAWQSFDEITEFKNIFEELRAQDESRSKANSHLKHPWVVLKKNTKQDGEKYLQEGPFSSEEVFSQITSGKLQYSDYAWKKGFDKWVRIGFIPEFDRMKDLDENSFFDYKVPLPEITDPSPNFSDETNEEILKSVRVLKKNETYYQNPEDDPEFESSPNFSEFEVTSVMPMEKTVFEEPARIEPKAKETVDPTPVINPVTAPPPEAPPNLEDITLVIKKSNEETPTPPEKVEEEPKKKTKIFTGFGKKETAKEETKEPQKEKAKEPIKEPKKEAAVKIVPKLKDKDKDKKKESFPKEDKRVPLEEPTVLVKREPTKKNYLSLAMTLFSIFALVAIILFGLYNYHSAIFGENATIDRLAQNIQRTFQKREEVSEPKRSAPSVRREEPRTQEQETAALDPNMKAKIESQLESGANQKLPDANVPPAPPPAQQAAVPESTRAGSQKASYVDIDFKNFVKNSKVGLLTNAPNGTVVLLYVSARTGEILTFPSFYREYKLTRKPNKNLEIDLSSLPPGRYNLEAEIGDLKKLKVLTIKEDDFTKKIEAHMKQVSFEQQKEKKALYYGTKSLETLLKKLFDTAKSTQAPSKEWSSFYSGFRQNTKTSLSSLVTSLNDSNRNNYAYPDEIFDLLDLKDSLLKNAEEIDKDLRSKKPIEAKTEQDLYRDLEKIRKRAAVLSVRKTAS